MSVVFDGSLLELELELEGALGDSSLHARGAVVAVGDVEGERGGLVGLGSDVGEQREAPGSEGHPQQRLALGANSGAKGSPAVGNGPHCHPGALGDPWLPWLLAVLGVGVLGCSTHVVNPAIEPC